MHSSVTIGRVARLKLSPTSPKPHIQNGMVGVVSYCFRNGQDVAIDLLHKSPTQSRRATDCAELLHPGRNSAFQNVIEQFRRLEQLIRDIPSDDFWHLTFLPNKSLGGPNFSSGELCWKPPRGRRTDMLQNTVDVILRVLAQLIEKAYMQRLSSKCTGPDLYRANII